MDLKWGESKFALECDECGTTINTVTLYSLVGIPLDIDQYVICENCTGIFEEWVANRE